MAFWHSIVCFHGKNFSPDQKFVWFNTIIFELRSLLCIAIYSSIFNFGKCVVLAFGDRSRWAKHTNGKQMAWLNYGIVKTFSVCSRKMVARFINESLWTSHIHIVHRSFPYRSLMNLSVKVAFNCNIPHIQRVICTCWWAAHITSPIPCSFLSKDIVISLCCWRKAGDWNAKMKHLASTMSGSCKSSEQHRVEGILYHSS